MRPILESPVQPGELARVLPLARRIYVSHERGQPHDDLREELGEMVGNTITAFDICSAFGSVSEEMFVFDLLAWHVAIPNDLTELEMLELLQHILDPEKDELREAFWLRCLVQNTGDENLSDLIFWPGEYFQDGDNSRELSAEEILRTARESGRKHREN